MKKIIALILSLVLVVLLYGCDTDGDVIIREDTFIMQVQDIRLNERNFLGRTITFEGIFNSSWHDSETGVTYYRVIRYGFDAAGCCIDEVGFIVTWTDEDKEYPEDDEWVEVVGVLTKDNHSLLIIELISLTVLEERGQEFVR